MSAAQTKVQIGDFLSIGIVAILFTVVILLTN